MFSLLGRAAGKDNRFLLLLPLENAFDQRGEQAPFFALQFDFLGQEAMVSGVAASAPGRNARDPAGAVSVPAGFCSQD